MYLCWSGEWVSGSLLCDDDDEIQCGGDYTIVYIYIYISFFLSKLVQWGIVCE